MRGANVAAGVLGLGVAGVWALAACTDLITPIPTPDSGAPPSGQVLKRTDPSCVAPPYGAHVVYQAQSNNHLFRIDATVGAAAPEDLSLKLDAFGTGSDDFINVAPDGDWLLVGGTRFGCDQSCLALVGRDACSAQVVVSGGAPVSASGQAAVASGGNAIVFPLDKTSARRDLFVIRRADATTWTAPINITATSPGVLNQRPAISADGTKVVFDCVPDPNAVAGTALCEVGLDGQGLKVTKAADLGVPVTGDSYLAHGDYAKDGSLVCEAWLNDSAQVWQLAGGKPRLLNGEQLPTGEYKYGADTGPCVLPDDRVVSTWALRDPQKGIHELKITDLAGTNPQLLLPDVDVVDNGLGCGR
jgi:hypothetical protein